MQKFKIVWTSNPWIKWAIMAVATGLIGFFTSTAVNSISDYNRMLDREVAEVQNGVQQVQNSLALLALVANDKQPPSDSTIVELTQGLANLSERVKSLSVILPETARESGRYKDTMLALAASAREMTGSQNARKFVENVGEWYDAKETYDEKVQDSRNSAYLLAAILFE